jgi:hypothetical protein
MTYVLPQTGQIDRWVKTSVDQAQGKKQIKLIKRVSDEYADLKQYSKEVTEELNRLKQKQI